MVELFFCNNGVLLGDSWRGKYIEELKDKSKNENKKNNTEWRKKVFKKQANERNLQINLEKYQKRCPPPKIVAVLSIKKLSNFAIYVINQYC